jgi:L-ascorbate metabolism protein UlaG (beta-lactamase superfamily)
MILSPDVSVHFRPMFGSDGVPLREILRNLASVDFSRQRAVEIVRKSQDEHGLRRGIFDADSMARGGVPAGRDLLYPQRSTHWTFQLTSADKSVAPLAATVSSEHVGHFGRALRSSLRARTPEEHRHGLARLLPDFERFCVSKIEPGLDGWPAATQPGIYRREHASVVIRSATTSILVDPLCWIRRGASREVPIDRNERYDAVMITHGHGDHWHVASLLHHIDDDSSLIIAPHVPEASILAPDVFGSSLRSLGVRAETPEWGSILTVGDVVIEVLPFYGEQPTCDAPGPPINVRNWGNCYRFNTPQFSGVLLVDAGRDPMGDVCTPLRASVERFGPIDVVLSCLRTFDSPFFGGLETYWSTIPFEQLELLYQQLRAGTLSSTTAGPEGIAAACAAARARFFLPYAHGFQGIGTPIADVGWNRGDPSEDTMLARLRAALRRGKHADTQVIDWSPGDRAQIDSGGLTIRRGNVVMSTTSSSPA